MVRAFSRAARAGTTGSSCGYSRSNVRNWIVLSCGGGRRSARRSSPSRRSVRPAAPLLRRPGGQVEHEVESHLDEARNVLGPLDVAAHPVDRVRDAAEHDLLPRSAALERSGGSARGSMKSPVIRLVRESVRQATTQVSLLPPPCDEFTTSEPGLSATRVSPPGSTKIVLAVEDVRPQIDVPALEAVAGDRRHARQRQRRLGDVVARVRRRSCRANSSRCSARRRAGRSACRSRPTRSPPSRPARRGAPARTAGRPSSAADVSRHVRQDRLLAEVVPDHLRDVGVDRLVVGDAGAGGVGQRDAAAAGRRPSGPGTPSSESARNVCGSRKSSSMRR